MAKYRKKSVIVEAWVWDGRPETIYQIGKSGVLGGKTADSLTSPVHDWELHGRGAWQEYQLNLIINTLEGEMIANKGDYILKDINGGYYPCKPDIFKESYEEVEE